MSTRRWHIGLNLIFLVPGETGGMEVAARELIPALLRAAPPTMRFTAFINREAAVEAGPWRQLLPAVTVPVNARQRAQWVLGEQALLPVLAARSGVDLVHSLGSTAPLWGPFRRVVTVHDLIYARYPEAHLGLRAKGMGMLVPAAVRHSDRIVADSQSTREDLIGLLGVDPRRIDAIPLGLGALKRVEALPEHETRQRFALDGHRVLLSLSAKRRHKNLAALIGALARISPESRPILVLPGYHTAYEDELRRIAYDLGVSDDVRFLGWISEPEVEGLWQIADGFVFPSLYEGFGLPVLEAMARSVPVACSAASSLRELAGEAALLFDPHDEEEIATAVTRLLDDRALREQLKGLGRARASEFTWERTARHTIDTYARVLE